MSAGTRPGVRATRRALVGVAAAVSVALLAASPAAAAPSVDLAALPPALQQFRPGTAAWTNSPWMTSPTCKDRGGDFSIWAGAVITNTPGLLAFFQPAVFGPAAPAPEKPRNDEIVQGYQQLAGSILPTLPGGLCVDDLRAWTDPAPTTPFGFPWGVTEGDGHQSVYSCTPDPNTDRADSYPKYLGADRAMCDGFYVACAHVPDAERARCDAWNRFSDDYVRRVDQLRGKAINDHPAGATGDTNTQIASPGDIALGWFTGLVKSIADGAVTVLTQSMTFWTSTDRTSMLQSPAIAGIQGLLSYVGYALLLAGVIWQGTLLVVRRRIDAVVTTGLGLVSFVGWSTLAGSIAVLLNEAGNALATQVLSRSIAGFSNAVGAALLGEVVLAPGAAFLFGMILFTLSGIQWALGFFRIGALVIILALVPTAAAGQLTQRTKPWLGKVLGWGLALILYQPVAAVVFSVGFELVGGGRDMSTILVGLAVITLALVSMPAMMRFFDWGGQQLTTSHSGGGGGAMAVGAAASVLGGSGAGSFGRFMDQTGPASGGSPSTGADPLTVAPAHTGELPASGAASAPGGAALPAGSAAPRPAPARGQASAASSPDDQGGSPAPQRRTDGPTGAPASGTGMSGAQGAGARSVTPDSSAASGGGAAATAATAAGPAGAAAAGAQAAAGAAHKAVDAASGAMTDPADGAS